MSCSNTINNLKSLAVKLGCAENTASVTGDTIDEVIDFINDNYKLPAIPTSAGNYKLVVDAQGAATWTLIV